MAVATGCAWCIACEPAVSIANVHHPTRHPATTGLMYPSPHAICRTSVRMQQIGSDSN